MASALADETTLTLEAFRERWHTVRGWEIEDAKERVLAHEEGPLWVTAGPGTGKTEALIIRTLRLLLVDGVAPESIMLTTFTDKGATELEDRLIATVEAFGYGDQVAVENVRVGTLHGLCDQIMREFRYPDYIDLELLDADDQRFFVHEHVEGTEWFRSHEGVSKFFDPVDFRLRPWETPDEWLATDAMITVLNAARQYDVDVDALAAADEPVLRALAEQVRSYEATLREHYRVDFSGQLRHFTDFLTSDVGERFLLGDAKAEVPPLEHVLVDEYQDTNPLQEAIYLMLALACEGNITVVGDDDQALYRFRGGSVACMVRFGEQCVTHLGAEPVEVQLRNNHRSHPDIVAWINQFIGNHPELPMAVRAGEKKPLKPAAADPHGGAGLIALDSAQMEPAEQVAALTEHLMKTGAIDDYSQVAVLLRSTRVPKYAGVYERAFARRDIPVYNPRSKALLKQQEVQLLMGALVTLLDPEGRVSAAPDLAGSDALRDTVRTWREVLQAHLQRNEGGPLDGYLSEGQAAIEAMPRGVEVDTLQAIFYRLLSVDPFSSWREEDPNRAVRLARISKLLDAYSKVHPDPVRISTRHQGRISGRWLREFYRRFVEFVATKDFDEPEDPYDALPAGYVQVMTVHQAKGLEFPVVFAGTLNFGAYPGGAHFLEEQLAPYSRLSPTGSDEERAAADRVRLLYVQYSRAEDLLVLVDDPHEAEPAALGCDAEGTPVDGDWFAEEGRLVGGPDGFALIDGIDHPKVDDGGPRRRYSVTGDVISYRRCARQYGHFTDLGYRPEGTGQLFFGHVVHRTLDRLHQHYSGQIDGVRGGEVPDDATVEGYFTAVSQSLQAHGVFPLSAQAEAVALEYIQRFNREQGPTLYPLVRDTEHHLQGAYDEFVLEGTVDVLARSNDDRDDPGTWEIWDYKAGKRPSMDGPDMQNYRFQMQVYARLFEVKNGTLPDRAILYFLGEADADAATVEVPFDPASIDDALEVFASSVEEIEAHRHANRWPAPSPGEAPDTATCAACDLRWDCPSVGDAYPRRLP
jgi:superfamily I DNA/RNA helicase/RecB family exonuclease